MRYFSVFYLIIWLLTSSGVLSGKKIVHMEGSYDIDNDNLLEFISLELNPESDVFPNVVRYY